MNKNPDRKHPDYVETVTESIGSQVFEVTEPADLTVRPMPYKIPQPWPEGVPVPPPEPPQPRSQPEKRDQSA